MTAGASPRIACSLHAAVPRTRCGYRHPDGRAGESTLFRRPHMFDIDRACELAERDQYAPQIVVVLARYPFLERDVFLRGFAV